MNEFELLYYYRINPTITFHHIERQFEKLIYASIHNVCYNFSQLCFEVSDAYQEGLFALLTSLDRFREDVGSLFSSYLYKCVSSSTRLLVRKHRSLSFGILDRSISLSFPVTLDESVTLIDIVTEKSFQYDPQYMALFEEKSDNIKILINSLSDLEQKVFVMRNQGYSYDEISKQNNVSSKKVDNILQKIRRLSKELV